MSHAFLRQISTRDPEAVHVIIWDQAGFHQNTDTSLDQLPPNVRIISLPPYCPELNPVERFGGLLKAAVGNRLCSTLPRLEVTSRPPPASGHGPNASAPSSTTGSPFW